LGGLKKKRCPANYLLKKILKLGNTYEKKGDEEKLWTKRQRGEKRQFYDDEPKGLFRRGGEENPRMGKVGKCLFAFGWALKLTFGGGSTRRGGGTGHHNHEKREEK